MTIPTKPILYNGFKIKKDLTIKSRLERIFFTEVYSLSDERFLYLFTNIRPDEIIDRGKKYDIETVSCEGKKYLGVIIDIHSHEKMSRIIDDLTILKGFDQVAGMKE